VALIKKLQERIDVLGCRFVGPKFIGAKHIGGVLECGAELKKQGYGVTYNLLGEHVRDAEVIKKAVTTMMMLIYNMKAENIGNICCKPTLFGLDISREAFIGSLKEILVVAKDKNVEVEIDAESFKYIHDTFLIFHFFASQPRFRKFIRQAVQAHLKNVLMLIPEYKLWNKQLRIVKGSGVYQEDKLIVEKYESLTERKYLQILEENMKNHQVPFAATIRDRKLTRSVIDVMDGKKDNVEFQLMYGPLGKKLGKELLQQGYRVRIYIPFVADWCEDAWKSYGLRRASMMRKIMWKDLKSKIIGI